MCVCLQTFFLHTKTVITEACVSIMLVTGCHLSAWLFCVCFSNSTVGFIDVDISDFIFVARLSSLYQNQN